MKRGPMPALNIMMDGVPMPCMNLQLLDLCRSSLLEEELEDFLLPSHCEEQVTM